MEKKYWQSFGEFNQSESFQQKAENEFQEQLLPLEDLDDKGLLDAKSPRRDFLKYLGFSTAAATLAASCELPVRKVVPYLQKPESLIPGVANYYASTYISEGDVIPVIVKQRDGRPIKIEGNDKSAVTGGGTSARAQASVLDLYDGTRLRYPSQEQKEIPSFAQLDKAITEKIAGKPVVLLTSTLNSPSTAQIVAEFIAKYPGSRHVQYDAISYSGMLLANEACYGKKAIPSYHFDNAKVIVSLGADFLGTWLSPVEFAYQYSKNRRVSDKKADMSRHIHFEGSLSLTGSNADDRIIHKPSETAAIALNILAKLGGAVTAPSLSGELAAGVKLAVDQLTAHKGEALVVCGSNDMNLQVIVNAINELAGANGKTINWAVTSNYRQGIDADFNNLLNEMNAGSVGALMIYGANPAYTYADSKKFADALKKVPVSISFNPTMDETTELCKYSVPAHNWLENWGDAEAKTGYYSLIQPTINPLFKTRAFQDSLLKWSGNPMDYETYFRDFWTKKLGSTEAYFTALQDGVVQPAEMTFGTATFNAGAVADAAMKATVSKTTGAYELVIYQKVSMGTGSQANNPWLQELPDPISKVTWDNYAMISPALAKTLLKIDVLGSQRDGDRYEVTPEKPVITIKANGKEISLPALIIPGLHADVVAIAVGYGRQSADKEKTKEYIGLSANGSGLNAYPLVSFNGTSYTYTSGADISLSDKEPYPLAQTQVHGSSESRPVIYETSLAKFIADPSGVLEEAVHERTELTERSEGEDFRKDATIYPDYARPGAKWGMSIDLNTCTGCSACVVACTAENNVAVVGKLQVTRYHEMHWLRIDRYFTGDISNPDVVFQPMLCQHCDNAPCENVCPVAATNHSSEGLNQMTYNRCIGTRYCANNCPYKVRRFNWLDYNGSDSFPDNQDPIIGVDLNDVTTQMNDDLTRMVLNPDVTVRSRGVIEKCSFCVQRLQENKLIAKKAEDPSLIRNVKTACMQACPTHAISFSNVNDKESDVYKIRNEEQTHRAFYVLEQLHVLPNVNYLAKIKNTDRHVTNEKEEGEGAEKPEAKKEAEKEHA